MRQDIMEKVLALVLMAWAIALLMGEHLQDTLFGMPKEKTEVVVRSTPGSPGGAKGGGIQASLSC